MNTAAQMPSTQKNILVWDFPTRIFHWALAISFGTAYLTAEQTGYALAHQISGYLFAALLGFRLVWGLAGSRYARFAEFLRSPATTADYMRGFFKGKPAHYLGHNPLGAIAIVLMLALGAVIAVTGWLNVSAADGETWEEIHELFANALLIVVLLHILGVIASSIMHRANLARAMVTGYKPGPADAGIRTGHGIIAILLIAALAAFGWSLSQGKLPALLDPAAASAGHGGAANDHDRDPGDDKDDD